MYLIFIQNKIKTVIPQNTENIISDPQVQANYIPPSSNQDYITEHEENEDIINNYAAKEKKPKIKTQVSRTKRKV